MPNNIKDILSDAYFNMGRILYDPNFFHYTPKDDCKKKEQACAIITKGGHAFQNAVHNTLSTKNSSGDFAPKPTTKVLLRLAEESIMLIGKAAPLIPRLATSSAFLYAACIGGGFVLLTDDTTRNMLMDQVGQLTSSFQDRVTEDKDLTPDTKPTEEYKISSYYI